jgi:hypothetical protein
MEPERAYGRAGRKQLVVRRLSGESDDGALQGADEGERHGLGRRDRHSTVSTPARPSLSRSASALAIPLAKPRLSP